MGVIGHDTEGTEDMSTDGPRYFASTGAGSPSKPAIVDPDGDIVAVAQSPEYAAYIVKAMNAYANRVPRIGP